MHHTFNRTASLALIALVFVGLGFSTPASAEPPCTNPNLSDVGFRIAKGRHKGRPNGVRRLQLKRSFSRELHFQVRFKDDVRYTTADPRNQGDWNKLLGFTTNRIHKNSVRLGWAFDPSLGESGEVRLGFYGYLDGVRTMERLGSVPLNAWADVSIRFDSGGMSVRVGDKEKTVRGDLGVADWVPVSTWLLRTAYFGGDEKAPHTMHIEVRNLVVDEPCRR